jgi:hypothetical protein
MKNKKIELKREPETKVKTLIEQRDEILINGKKLERGKDYEITKIGKLILSPTIEKQLAQAKNLIFESSFSQKIRKITYPNKK